MMSTENQVDDKTKELVGECIKQAFGNLKDYLDINLAKQKQDNDRLLQSTSQQVVELKRATELQFKYKGNKSQFVFNAGLLERIKQIDEYIAEGNITEVKEEVEKTRVSLKKRNKLIRLADKSEGGACK